MNPEVIDKLREAYQQAIDSYHANDKPDFEGGRAYGLKQALEIVAEAVEAKQ